MKGYERGGAAPRVGLPQIRMRIWSDQRDPIGGGADAVGWPVLRAIARSFSPLLPLEDYSLEIIMSKKANERQYSSFNGLNTISVSNFTKFSHVHVSLVCK